jgi:hypothetical protein
MTLQITLLISLILIHCPSQKLKKSSHNAPMPKTKAKKIMIYITNPWSTTTYNSIKLFIFFACHNYNGFQHLNFLFSPKKHKFLQHKLNFLKKFYYYYYLGGGGGWGLFVFVMHIVPTTTDIWHKIIHKRSIARKKEKNIFVEKLNSLPPPPHPPCAFILFIHVFAFVAREVVVF